MSAGYDEVDTRKVFLQSRIGGAASINEFDSLYRELAK